MGFFVFFFSRVCRVKSVRFRSSDRGASVSGVTLSLEP